MNDEGGIERKITPKKKQIATLIDIARSCGYYDDESKTIKHRSTSNE